MRDYLSWLPPLVRLEDYGGDWSRYEDAIYEYFWRDFVDSRPTFEGKRFRLKRRPLLNDKECTFWHLITDGRDEQNRIPDLRRCERIRWPRPMIEAAFTEKVKCWRDRRDNEERIVIALPDFSYVVVLAERGDYILLWTAYCVEFERRRQQLEKEYANCTRKEKLTAPG